MTSRVFNMTRNKDLCALFMTGGVNLSSEPIQISAVNVICTAVEIDYNYIREARPMTESWPRYNSWMIFRSN